MPPRPSLDEYRLVREKERVVGAENDIRVTVSHNQHGYVSYALALLNGEDGKTQHNCVRIKGMGSAISHVVNVAEIIKRSVAGLHQITETSTEVKKDEYEAIDQTAGENRLEVERKVSTILITLSREPLDKSNPGYQAPLPESMITGWDPREAADRPRRHGARSGRGRSRGGRGEGGERNRERSDEHNGERSGERGSGRGRGGRGGRGGFRGGRGDSRRDDRRDDRRED